MNVLSNNKISNTFVWNTVSILSKTYNVVSMCMIVNQRFVRIVQSIQ